MAGVMLGAIGLGWWMLEGAETHQITIAAGPSTGGAFEVATAIAEVTERYHPDIEVEVIETLGSVQNVTLLAGGRVELATVLADTRTGPESRMVASLFPDVFQLLVREDSEIRSVGELRGHRIALPPRGAGQYGSFWSLAEQYGLSDADLLAFTMSNAAADWALINGAVDAVFRVQAAGDDDLSLLTRRVPSQLIPIEQAAAMRLHQPALGIGTIPVGAYRGSPPVPPSDLVTVEVPLLLIAGRGLDEGVATAVTRLLFERRRDLVDRTRLAGFIAPPVSGGGTFMPVHDGAASYYNRDEPSFLQQNYQAFALFFSVAALMASGLFRLASGRKRRRIDRYNRAILGLGADATHLNDHAQIQARRDRLFDIAGAAVDDAEVGLVSAEGFSLFTFTWNMVNNRLDEREAELGP